MKILILEDNPNLMWVIRIMLEGSELYEAKTLREAKEFVGRVDLVISDYDMTTVRFEEIRSLFEENNTPIILQTGRKEPIYKNQLVKPYSKTDLLEMIQRVKS